MAARRTAKVRIEGEDAGLGRTLQRTENRFTRFSATLRQFSVLLSGAVLAGFAVLDRALRAAADAAASAESSLLKVQNSLELSGESAGTSAAEIREWSDALEDAIGVSKEEIETGFVLAQSFGATAEEARKLTAAAADFAQAADLNFTEALRRLGRATQGATEDVAKFVPEIKELVEAGGDAGDVADLIAERFGGAAQQALEGYEGALKRVTIAQNELTEAIGEGVIESEANLQALDLVAQQYQKNAELTDGLDVVTGRLSAGYTTLRLAFAKAQEGGLRLLNALFAETEQEKELKEASEDAAAALDGQTTATNKLTTSTDRAAESVERFNAQQDAARQLAAELGFTLESDLLEKLDTNERALIALDDAYQQGIITRRDFERGQNELNQSSAELSARIQQNVTDLQLADAAYVDADGSVRSYASGLDVATGAQRRFRAETVQATQAIEAQSLAENAITGGRSEFSTVGGGQFTVNDRSIVAGTSIRTTSTLRAEILGARRRTLNP